MGWQSFVCVSVGWGGYGWLSVCLWVQCIGGHIPDCFFKGRNLLLQTSAAWNIVHLHPFLKHTPSALIGMSLSNRSPERSLSDFRCSPPLSMCRGLIEQSCVMMMMTGRLVQTSNTPCGEVAIVPVTDRRLPGSHRTGSLTLGPSKAFPQEKSTA